MFTFFKKAVAGIYNKISQSLQSLFSKTTIDQADLDTVYQALIAADAGPTFAQKLIDAIRYSGKTGPELHAFVRQYLITILTAKTYQPNADITLLVGINGSGKTTAAAKFAARDHAAGKKVLLVAADTFRAAAVAQLELWANRIGIPLYKGKPEQDPAAVIYQGVTQHPQQNSIIIDTAGRLQTKINLMHELEKITRVLKKAAPHKTITTLLTIDALIGQNSIEQARLFTQAAPIDGIILTKMDSTSKGAAIFTIVQELNIPIAYVSTGETLNSIAPFDAPAFVDNLLQNLEN